MNKLDCTIPELVNILVTMEGTLKSSRGTIFTMEQTSSKRKSTRKKKVKSAKKQKKKNKPKKEVPNKAKAKEKYFHYHAEDHWRRNCQIYLKSLKIKKDDKPSEGMLVIKSNLMIFSTSNWVLDSDSSAHIYTSM